MAQSVKVRKTRADLLAPGDVFANGANRGGVVVFVQPMRDVVAILFDTKEGVRFDEDRLPHEAVDICDEERCPECDRSDGAHYLTCGIVGHGPKEE